ncbi:NADPH-dependent F420 reductase [Nocardioides mangrovi]|uniref:NAD(P)-binding domain-containing protein n=1 Tax=Nocardioides mangrovi TaxID=2874580 RepID=A0ABS7UIL4_9ACTN|nr:NAD(P)-binding domain-containing protein [Nocardioides mangrovi]MBZ5740875.1 NAD(P)-binding domain-containing protein [Nocardioides mangrovi]
MKITVLGTGGVGRAVAGRLDDLGHDVTMATRDPAATAARDEHAAWADTHPGVRLAAFAGSAAGADLVVNALGGDVVLANLALVGDDLDGRVLLDLSNPLDHSQGFPPRLFVKDDDSLAEQVQRAHPRARVVKSLNTMNNALMVDPASLGEDTSVFVSGDDAEAKATVTDLLRSMGHTDVIDLGGLETARGPEMFLALWIRTAVALGGSDFNIKVVRGPSLRD